MVELIDEAQKIASRARPGTVIEGAHILPGNGDGAAGRRVQKARNLEKRRFSGARWRDKGDDLALGYAQIDAAQHLDNASPLPKVTAEIGEAQYLARLVAGARPSCGRFSADGAGSGGAIGPALPLWPLITHSAAPRPDPCGRRGWPGTRLQAARAPARPPPLPPHPSTACQRESC